MYRNKNVDMQLGKGPYHGLELNKKMRYVLNLAENSFKNDITYAAFYLNVKIFKPESFRSQSRNSCNRKTFTTPSPPHDIKNKLINIRNICM